MGLAASAALVGACSQTPTPDPPGLALYTEYCAECHGAEGISTDGNPAAPNLAGQGLLRVADDDYLFENIARARPGPGSEGRDVGRSDAFGEAYGGPLGDDEIRAIIDHIRQWQTEPSIVLEPYRADGDARAGAAIYAVCAPCHGSDGWSNRAPSLAGSTLQDTASDAFLRHTILNGRPGCEMAGFDLTEDEIADLVAHIRTLGR
jgi:mono/diheme cytochrome c family protein